MRLFLSSTLLLILTASLSQTIQFHPGIKTICYTSALSSNEKTAVSSAFDITAEPTADINVTYNGFTPEAQAAFQYAVDIWARTITSDVPIRITANWSMLGSNVLGSASAVNLVSNFDNAPLKDVRYPIALAEKLSRKQLNLAVQSEISANFSSELDWYYGTDANPGANQFDMVSVVLHEIGHGLGFSASFGANGQNAAWGLSNVGSTNTPVVYDLYLEDTFGNQLIDTAVYENNSSELLTAVTNNNVLFASSIVKGVFGNFPPIYSPNPWDGGSSISHLDETAFAAGNPNSLMSPQFARGEAIHLPGEITEALFAELGWVYSFLDHEQIHFAENFDELIELSLVLESDSAINESQIKLTLSQDNFATETTILPSAAGVNNDFTFEVGSFSETKEISYYFQYTEPNSRVHQLPGPDTIFFQLVVGEDGKAPKIEHQPVSVALQDDIEIMFKSFDNFGLDTLNLEYRIGFSSTSAFVGLRPSSDSTDSLHSFVLNRGTIGLNSESDTLYYRIHAVDKSKNSNATAFPENGFIKVLNPQIGAPLERYALDFSSSSFSDSVAVNNLFIEDVSQFSGNAIHSNHPYQNGFEGFGSILLKHPVLLKENSVISIDEVVLLEPGVTSDIRADFLRIEGSIDDGMTWIKLTEDQDASSNPLWLERFNSNLNSGNSNASGDSELFMNKRIELMRDDLPFQVDDELLIKISMITDNVNTGWGIALDNLVVGTPNITGLPDRRQIKIFPNPLSNTLIISNVKAAEKILVRGLTGSVLFEQNLKSEKSVIDLSLLPDGVFLLQVLDQNNVLITTKRIIKQ